MNPSNSRRRSKAPSPWFGNGSIRSRPPRQTPISIFETSGQCCLNLLEIVEQDPIPANGRAVLGERQISDQRRECVSQQPRDVLYDVDVRLQENLRV
jgi:hypothetical protein